MSQLPRNLYTAKQTRALDAIAIQKRGIAGIKLMKRAGKVAFDNILMRWSPQCLHVFCGAGNNGGDGYIIAGLAADAGWPVQVYAVTSPDKLVDDALLAYKFAVQSGVSIRAFNDSVDLSEGVVVDALLGTGLTRQVEGCFEQAINLINGSDCPVLAVDVPSGLSADTGMPQGCAVHAHCTVTFIGLKQGLLTGKAPDYCGELVFSQLEIPSDIYTEIESSVTRLELLDYSHYLQPRKRCAHKGDFGRVLIIGGDSGFGGAIAMAAEAALRTGAGLVSVATQAEHIAPVLARTPEAMVRAVANKHQLQSMLENVEVLVVGPGLGQSAWSEQMLQCALAANLPTVLDADALNLIAQNDGLQGDHSNWMMTPHPGEAARLLGSTITDVQADRFKAVKQLQDRFQASVLLKGAGSLVCVNQQNVQISCYGNPGMATGGMGDVLSGIIGSLLGQGISPEAVLPLAVCLHGRAADIVAENRGERGMLPTDLFSALQKLVNGLL